MRLRIPNRMRARLHSAPLPNCSASLASHASLARHVAPAIIPQHHPAHVANNFDARAAFGGRLVQYTTALNEQVLIELLHSAEAETDGEPIERAVLTVPAYFSEAQRRATRTAAQLAGLNDVTLLPEPVAAALAYGLQGDFGKVLVFDLGTCQICNSE